MKATLGKRFSTWVEAPLGKLSPELRELARSQQVGALVIFVMLMIWVPLLFAMGRTLMGIVMGISFLIAVGSALFLSRRGKPLVAGQLMLTSLSICLLYIIGASGGMGESSAGWIVMIPMIALFYLPVQDAGRWTLIACLGTVVIWLMEGQGWISAKALDDESTRVLNLLSLLMLVGATAGMLFMRRRAWLQVNVVLRTTNEELQKEVQVRQRAEEDAKNAVTARTAFLATISHEIRTPLNGVLGITEVLLDTDLDPEQRELAVMVESSGKLLRALLNDVLDYSKIDAGRVDLERIALSLPNLLGRVSKSWGKLARDKGIDLDLELGSDVPEWIFGDPMRLEQMLNNLVSNAFKFTWSGEIRLQVQVEQGRLQIGVRDTGVGMSEKAQKHIFQAFRQADSSVNRHYGGTGMGLAISRSLALAMDGDLRVVSALGQGSVFTLDLPIEVAEPPCIAEPPPQEVLDLRGVRILVVEDNLVNQVVVTRFLERLGAEVTVVPDGQACLDAWERVGPDLVLTDCHMPIMNGYQATAVLRNRGVCTPIIALTANNMPGDRVRSIQAGMDDHLGKPIQVGALNACLQRWLRPRAS